MRYAGADWIEGTLRCQCSPLGRLVADVLGAAWAGIYHLRTSWLRRAAWSDPDVIDVYVGLGADLATFDGDRLTRIVILAHDLCVRVEIVAAGPRGLRLLFHRREPVAVRLAQRHPRLEDAIVRLRVEMGLQPLPGRGIAALIPATTEGDR